MWRHWRDVCTLERLPAFKGRWLWSDITITPPRACSVCRTAERAAAEEPCCDCLFCGASGPESSLSCAACRRALPFCAASGRRMVLQDWSACPSEC